MCISTMNLTERHIQILQLAADGLTYKEIAVELELAFQTIHNHASDILRIIDAKSMTNAVAIAFRRGLIA